MKQTKRSPSDEVKQGISSTSLVDPSSSKDGNCTMNTSVIYDGPDAYIQDVLKAISNIRAITITISFAAVILVAFATYTCVAKVESRAHRANSKAIAEHINTIFLSDLSAKFWAARAISVSISAVAHSASDSQTEATTTLLQRLLPEALPGLIGSRVSWSPLEAYVGREICEAVSGDKLPKACRDYWWTNSTGLSYHEEKSWLGLPLAKLCDSTRLERKLPFQCADEMSFAFNTNRPQYVKRGMEHHRALGKLMLSRLPVVSKIFGLADDQKGLINEQEPLVTLFAPVLGPDTGGNLMGLLSIDFKWSTMAIGGLPPASEGTVLSVLNSCDQALSYQVKGASLTYLGQGGNRDLPFSPIFFETTFDDFKALQRSFGFLRSGRDESGCRYRIRVYPSGPKQVLSNRSPSLCTTAVVLIFALTLVVFGASDFLIGRQQKRLLECMKRSNDLISSLFPESVKSRVLGDRLRPPRSCQSAMEAIKGLKVAAATSDLQESSKQHLRRILSVQQDIVNLNIDRDSEPIADFFPETTVIFADIAGFTAWSSERDPSQVFKLLETVFGIFDKIANRLGVFKVETVGDCYVAVAGLPEPRKDHAVIMSWFAYECMVHMRELINTLESSMGPSTADLCLRIGLHSGPVTAGVLRGEKSRFQLFGDTVNTASRMESTGWDNMIQVSDATADLLVSAGKSHWMTRRHDLVSIKGKGEMRSFWVNPTRGLTAKSLSASLLPMNRFGVGGPEATVVDSHCSISKRNFSWGLRCNTSLERFIYKNSCSDFSESKSPPEKLVRLVDWNGELLLGLLVKLVVWRAAERDSPSNSSSLLPQQNVEVRTPWEERAECIQMPLFDNREVSNSNHARTELSPAIQAQLHSYVEGIAYRYQDHSFHNFEHASHVSLSASKLMKRIISPDDVECMPGCGHTKDTLARGIHDRTLGISSDPLMQFAVVFSAVIHDVEHRGVPNSQLVKEDPTLKTKYYGKSVAEQNSIQVAWDLLMEDRFADLRACIYTNEDERQRFRQLLVNAVIATDIEDRELCSERKRRWDKAFNRSSTELDDVVDRQATIVFEYIIQASDVAHTMQHWYIYRKWNERLFEERFAAYRQGRAQEDPSANWYANEISFFDNYIIPLARKLKDCGVFGVSGDEYLNYAQENRREWEVKGKSIVEGLASKYQLDSGASSTEAFDDSWGLFVGTDDGDSTVPLTSPVA